MDTTQVKRLAEIGIALSAERDINKILEMILVEAKSLSKADGGTLYTLDENRKCLNFEIFRNDTLDTTMGGTSGIEVPFPPVPLEIDGKANFANVSSHVALTGETVNIPDLYEAEGFDFSGARSYDQTTGYRSRSILVIPMKDHENSIIGVLQLVNAKDQQTGEIVPFLSGNVDLIASLASQAAVVLTNRRLIDDLSNLFDAFIKTIATAIDEKSPYTGGHIRRVTELTMIIAEKINGTAKGPFADVCFTSDELEELRIAAWMHDVGKVALPEHIVSKRTKLQTLFDRVLVIETRFELIRQVKNTEHLRSRSEMAAEGTSVERLEASDETFRHEIEQLKKDEEFVIHCNLPRPLSDKDIDRLNQVAARTYWLDGVEHDYLTSEELGYLTIRRGTLTGEERKVIENHAMMSIRMLGELPFPKKLARVPEYAGGHHERLDGSGYPLGLNADQLPLQARIIAVADIFEALTARDRPYKQPLKLTEAMEVLRKMKESNHIDPDVYDLLVQTDLVEKYVERETSGS